MNGCESFDQCDFMNKTLHYVHDHGIDSFTSNFQAAVKYRNNQCIKCVECTLKRYSVITLQSAKMRDTIIVVFRISVFRFWHLNINMVIKEMS